MNFVSPESFHVMLKNIDDFVYICVEYDHAGEKQQRWMRVVSRITITQEKTINRNQQQKDMWKKTTKC